MAYGSRALTIESTVRRLGEIIMNWEAIGLIAELVGVVAVGATETEKWSSLDRESIDFAYLRVIFEENPGLVNYWDRYRHIGATVSEEFVKAVDDLIIELQSGT